MTFSIAWSELCIGAREEETEILLMRRFQLRADNLEDRTYEGAVGLRLSNSHTREHYQLMTLSSVLQYCTEENATIVLNSDEDIHALGPYLNEVAQTFGEKLSERSAN